MIKLFGASVRGTSHMQTDTPCHDAHRYRILPGNWGYIACVSDGMGSAIAAEIGSDVASSFIVDYLEKHIDPKLDDEDIIRYYSEGKHQVFTRTRTIIGRNVYLCHPPKLVPVIRNMIEDFRSGRKDSQIVPVRKG
ncbi:MAG: protein phosphatase 2C domain-containing protein, partial [Acholeplasmataceae bacterium]|nr:protein phosphatase 2C domain-containing protein [Acholeplasmataceae bacterium]